MLRTGASRVVFRSIKASTARPVRTSFNGAAYPAQWTSKLCSLSAKRPQPLINNQLKPIQATVFQRTATSTPWDKIDKKNEEKIAHQKLEPTPETVSATSSIHPVLGEVATPEPEGDVDMMAGLKQDVVSRSPLCMRSNLS